MKISNSDKNKSLLNFFEMKLILNLKTSLFSILKKEVREIIILKGVCKRGVQAELSLINILKMRTRAIQYNFKCFNA